ncbi:MAG TPA: energy transducer TonB [Terriglobales bacterium]|nr:energy transducer TonB [Terriglobales bacterium]
MFADSLLDFALTNRSRRGWATLIAFCTQAVAVGGLLTIPLLYTQGLPSLHLMRSEVIGPPPALAPQPQGAPMHGMNVVVRNPMRLPLIPPKHIPKGVAPDTGVPIGPPPELTVGGGGSSAHGPGVPNGIADSISGLNPIVIPTRPIIHHPPTSHMMEGNLIHQVEPTYPPLAIQTRTQGRVVLQAVISREGRIENLQVVSGHPLLVKAAIDAVRQWRYRPYVLNGEPVEVETQVTVNFVLSGG